VALTVSWLWQFRGFGGFVSTYLSVDLNKIISFISTYLSVSGALKILCSFIDASRNYRVPL
jgi:hypothetical protein